MAFLENVVNLEMDNSLKWVLFNRAIRKQEMHCGSKARYFY